MDKNKIIEAIHNKALSVAKNYRRCEYELIDILVELDRNRVFTHKKYSSLFQYATGAMGLSEEVAYIFINVARKSREVPALKEKIRTGEITVSKAKRIASVINNKNKDQWLKLAQSGTKNKIEREVARVSPKQAVREKTLFVNVHDEIKDKVTLLTRAEDRIQLQVGVSEKIMIKLRRVQDLLSQQKGKAASLEQVLDEMSKFYIEKKDPLKKAVRQKIRGKLQNGTVPRHSLKTEVRKVGSEEKERGKLQNGTVPGHSLKTDVRKVGREEKDRDKLQFQQVLGLVEKGIKNRRIPLTAKIKNQVILQYNGRCAAIDQNQKRCSQRRWLDIHHKKKVSDGGGNELSNLILLCKGHHNMHHIH